MANTLHRNELALVHTSSALTTGALSEREIEREIDREREKERGDRDRETDVLYLEPQ